MLAHALGTLLLTIGPYVIGLAGIALAVVFYVRSRKFKRMTFAARSFTLLSDSVSSLPNFAATYQGRPLSVLTATKLLLWNSGSEVVSSNDIAHTDPIRLTLPDGFTILDARVAVSSSPTNLARIAVSQSHANEANLVFDYLAPNEGCLISALHTGPTEADIKVGGTIKGAGSPTERAKARNRILEKLLFDLLSIAAVLAAVALLKEGFPWLLLAPLPIALALVAALLLGRYRRRMTGQMLDRRFRDAFSASEFL
jgi:hypothetical protein